MTNAIRLQFDIMDKLTKIIYAVSAKDNDLLTSSVQEHTQLLNDLRVLAQKAETQPEVQTGYLHTLGGKEEATDRLQMQPEEEE